MCDSEKIRAINVFQKIYRYIRLLVLRHKEPYCVFYKMLGFCPNNIELFERACRHRSATRHSKHKEDNERLEFLGDSVLGAIVSDLVYNTYSTKDEGFLSKTRSKIVQRETLNLVAVKLGLDKIMQATTQVLSHNNYMYGNALEALIGAIYIDQGYERCRYIVENRIIKPYINLEKIVQQEVNFKSRFIEWCQHHHMPYIFDVDNESVDEHKNPIFHSRVLLVQYPIGEGSGYSKKEAQQNAARAALKRIHKDKNLVATLREQMNTQSANEE